VLSEDRRCSSRKVMIDGPTVTRRDIGMDEHRRRFGVSIAGRSEPFSAANEGGVSLRK